MQALKTETVDLNQVIALTESQAKARYNLGRYVLIQIADKAQANIRIGRKKLYSREILDEYFKFLTE